MNPLQLHLHQLNNLNERILEELRKKEPSMDIVGHKMDQKEELISKLNSLTESDQKEVLSSGERQLITKLFDTFEELNKNIQRTLQKALNNRQEKWVQAANQRKAEDGYNQTRKPDISYF